MAITLQHVSYLFFGEVFAAPFGYNLRHRYTM